MFQIKNLQVQIKETDILRGISLDVKPGEIHAIMGPNGSGKSTLASSLAGHPAYDVVGGAVALNKQDLLELSPDERAKAGLFLAFQYPAEIPGVKVERFLRLARQTRFADKPDKQFVKAIEFRRYLETLADQLQVDRSLLQRGLNEGFSGGEKKRLEILQMAVLEPEYAILDETDSGLDIDAIKAVAEGVKTIVDQFKTGVLVITHYQRILTFLQPDVIHVLVDGRIVQSGGPELVTQLEAKGYQAWK